MLSSLTTTIATATTGTFVSAAATTMAATTTSTSTNHLLFLTTMAVAVATTTAIVLMTLPSDYMNRTFLLRTLKITNARQLWMKRIVSYQYQWNQAFIQQIRVFYNFNNHNDNTSGNASNDIHTTNHNTTNTPPPLNDNTNIELLVTKAEVEDFIRRILSPSSPSSSPPTMQELRVIHIGRDSECMMIPSESVVSYPPPKTTHMLDHYFVWFQYYSCDGKAHSDSHRQRMVVQVPLLLFSRSYQEMSEHPSYSTIRRTTFCFIYDTTQNSYFASRILFPLLTNVTKLLTPTETDEAPSSNTIRDTTNLPLNCYMNPSWMVQLAILLLSSQQQAPGDPSTTTSSYEQQILQCFTTFCNIEAYSLCEQIVTVPKSKHTATTNMNNNIMIYTIPTSVIPILLPTLHDIYPDDRHVFLYTGCIQTIHTMRLATDLHQSQTTPTPPYTFHSDTVAYTVPIYMNNSNKQHSSTVSDMLAPTNNKRIGNVQQYYDCMTRVPIHIASQVECYMAAIHTLFEQQHKKGISFLPYICKVDYLLPSLHLLSSAVIPSTTATTDAIKLRYSVRSILQYMTGSKSREMSNETLDAACSFLQEQSSHLLNTIATTTSTWSRHKNHTRVTLALQKSIEQIVFQHKLILLPNKTLLDTVQPVEQWTLKQPTKNGGCACCDEEPEDDDDDDNATRKMTNPRDNSVLEPDNTIRSRTTTMGTPTRGYVDGKTKFAFDPTQFA